tara:strand:+ start:1236 stop:1661 length:426 start_codon:yes stop_codon:yes gene_type:complete
MKFKGFNKKFSNAKKTRYDGILFDSKLECDRYKYLKQLEKEGLIKELKTQYAFKLIEKGEKQNHRINSIVRKNSKVISAVKYYADFFYYNVKLGCWIVNDAKGRTSEVYKLKLKLFLALNGENFEFLETYRDSKRNNFKEY